jgi:hypothetical protein
LTDLGGKKEEGVFKRSHRSSIERRIRNGIEKNESE